MLLCAGVHSTWELFSIWTRSYVNIGLSLYKYHHRAARVSRCCRVIMIVTGDILKLLACDTVQQYEVTNLPAGLTYDQAVNDQINDFFFWHYAMPVTIITSRPNTNPHHRVMFQHRYDVCWRFNCELLNNTKLHTRAVVFYTTLWPIAEARWCQGNVYNYLVTTT